MFDSSPGTVLHRQKDRRVLRCEKDEEVKVSSYTTAPTDHLGTLEFDFHRSAINSANVGNFRWTLPARSILSAGRTVILNLVPDLKVLCFTSWQSSSRQCTEYSILCGTLDNSRYGYLPKSMCVCV